MRSLYLLIGIFFLWHSGNALDLKHAYFDSLVIDRTSLPHAVDQINKIHESHKDGAPEFWILVEDPLGMTDQVSINLKQASLSTILSVLTSGTPYFYEISGNYIILKKNRTGGSPQISEIETEIADYTCTISVESYSDDMPVSGSGSGFICLLNGIPFVVTNVHVIEKARSFNDITISTRDGSLLNPVSAFIANDRDICIIRFESDSAVEALRPRADLQGIELGVPTYLYGNALGSDVLVRSQGTIKAIGPKLFELDISAFKGNSGGPVILQDDNTIIGVLTQGELISERDEFTEAALTKLQSPFQGNLRIFATRIDNIPATKWRQLKWSAWLEEKEIIQQHYKNLLALNELVSSNSTDFDSIRVNSKYIVECPELWRAYGRLDRDYHSALKKSNYDEAIRAIDNFIKTVDTLFMPLRGTYAKELTQHYWDYDWFSTSKSGNTSGRVKQSLLRWYSKLHNDWNNNKKQWQHGLKELLKDIKGEI